LRRRRTIVLLQEGSAFAFVEVVFRVNQVRRQVRVILVTMDDSIRDLLIHLPKRCGSVRPMLRPGLLSSPRVPAIPVPHTVIVILIKG